MAPGRAQLDLAFARSPAGETFLKRQYAAFPFHVTRTLGTGDEALVILQSLGAGLLRGDRFRSRIVALAGARARVETQGATVAHATPGGEARQVARLEAEPGARLAWLPRPLILFPDARVASTLEIVLHEGGRIVWRDAFLAHDAGGAGGRFARLDAETTLRRPDGATLAVDRFSIDGAALDETGPDARVHAALGWAGEDCGAALASRLRAALEARSDVYGGVSTLPGGAGLFARLAAPDGAALRRALVALEAAETP